MSQRAWIVWTALTLLSVGACNWREPRACEQYLARLSDCVARMGPQAKAAMAEHLRSEHAQFDRMARQKDARRRLAVQCEASLAAIAGTCP
jgi:hypothetical protein